MRRRGYYLWVTFSVLLCAVLFAPWFLPRETTSGLIGRWLTTERGWKRRTAVWMHLHLDRLFHRPFNMETCVEVYRLEEEARRALYRRGELD